MKSANLILMATSLIMAATAHAQSDAQIKSDLLGYWMSPRHPYLFQADGIARMGPPFTSASTSLPWDVHNGIFYENGEPYKIRKLTKSEFDYQAMRDSGVQVNGKFILTAPAGTVFQMRRISRKTAEAGGIGFIPFQ
jgi:hypothetical protein